MLIHATSPAGPTAASSQHGSVPDKSSDTVDAAATLEFFRICTKRLQVPENRFFALSRAAEHYMKSRSKGSTSPGMITVIQDLVADCRASTLISILQDVLAAGDGLPRARLEAPSDEAQRLLAQVNLIFLHVDVLAKDMQVHCKNPDAVLTAMPTLRQRASQQLRLLGVFTERLKEKFDISLIDWPGILCAREITLRELSILSELMYRSGEPLKHHQRLRDTIDAADKSRLDPQEVEQNRKLLRDLRDTASAEPQIQQLMHQNRVDALAQRATDVERWNTVANGSQYEMAQESFRRMQQDLRSLSALRSAAGVNQEALSKYSDDDINVMSAAFEMMYSLASQGQKGMLKQLHKAKRTHARAGMPSNTPFKHPSSAPAMLRDSQRAAQRQTDRDAAQSLASTMKKLADAGLQLAGICEEFRLIGAGALPAPFVHPQDLLMEADALLADAAKVPSESGVGGLIIEVEDLKSMATHVDQDSRADGLLWRQVQHLDRQTDVLAYVRRGLRDLRARLGSEGSQSAPTNRAVKNTIIKKATNPKDAENSISIAAESASRENCEAMRQQWLFKPHAEVDAEGNEGGWQRNTGGRGQQPANKLLAKETFSQGTFDSAWQSAAYHFKKHAAYHQKATFKQYVERALNARSEWDDVTRHFSLADPSKMVRVVSTHKTWLVFEDDPDGRIVSYHDRSERPYT